MIIWNLSDLESKGKSAFLLKSSSKRKRTKEELGTVKEVEKKFKKDKQGFFEEFKQMKEERSIMELNVDAGATALEMVQRL